jgi:MFS transporter, OFA family, oxalate/formate antiporter
MPDDSTQPLATPTTGVASSRIPFDPARWPFFYGWFIVVLGTIGILMSIPGQTMGVSAFTDSLIDALGLTRVQLSTAYMFGTIASSFVLTPVGRLSDRVGSRVMAFWGAVVLGLVLVWLSQCDRIAIFLRGTEGGKPVGWVAFAVILVGFFFVRLSGQGVLTLINRNMMMKWFSRYRGLVNAMSGLFVSFGFSFAPRILKGGMADYGWRGTWLLIAAVIGIGFSLVVLVFFRDNPEDCGLHPDGIDHATNPRTKPDRHPVHRQFTLPQARRTIAFWSFALTVSLYGLYVTGLMFHLESIFGEGGIDSKAAFRIFVPASVISVTMNFVASWLSDRIRLKYLLAVMQIGSIVSMAGCAFLAPGATKWMVIAGNGFAGGMWGVMMSVTWPRFFGREHLGAVTGFCMSMTVFASAIGPWLFSQSLARGGSYRWACFVCLAAMALVGLTTFRADNPQRKLAPEPTCP